jgi:hypothetical protein
MWVVTGGQGEEMTQALYAYMNYKTINKRNQFVFHKHMEELVI